LPPLDGFTDPFLLVGGGEFSWRQSKADLKRLAEYERLAGRWVASYRTLAPKIGRSAASLRQTLKLTPKSSIEEAMAAGERFAAEFELGPVPTERLTETMERRLGILVLMIGAVEGVSAAACRLADVDAVLIYRHQILGRRNFDLAHELFHILTWHTMPPDYAEKASEHSRKRVEQLANNFASAVLMPTPVLNRFVKHLGEAARTQIIRPSPGLPRVTVQGSLSRLERETVRLSPRMWGEGTFDWTALGNAIAWINAVADALQVTATALRRRLVALEWLDPETAQAIPNSLLRKRTGNKLPPLFSKRFMEVIAIAIKQRHVSAHRAADLLAMSLDDLADLCATYHLEAPLDRAVSGF